MLSSARLTIAAIVVTVFAACSSSSSGTGTTGPTSSSSSSASSSSSGAGGKGSSTGTGAGGMATGTGGAGGGGGGDICTAICAARAAKACPTPDSGCMAQCHDELGYAPWCSGVVDPYFQCLATTKGAYDCSGPNNSPGVAQPGPCDAPFAAVKGCFKSGPVTGFDATCMAWCAVATQVASCPVMGDCQASCMAAVATGQTCNGALAMELLCESKLTPADFGCTTTSTPYPRASMGHCMFQQQFLSTCN